MTPISEICINGGVAFAAATGAVLLLAAIIAGWFDWPRAIAVFGWLAAWAFTVAMTFIFVNIFQGANR